MLVNILRSQGRAADGVSQLTRLLCASARRVTISPTPPPTLEIDMWAPKYFQLIHRLSDIAPIRTKPCYIYLTPPTNQLLQFPFSAFCSLSSGCQLESVLLRRESAMSFFFFLFLLSAYLLPVHPVCVCDITTHTRAAGLVIDNNNRKEKNENIMYSTYVYIYIS